MSGLLKFLEPGQHGPKPGASDFTQLRKVPLQPEGLPLSVVFMGADLGNLPWSGTRPRAGDTVAVVGAPGSRTVIAREQPRVKNPIFGDRCKCKCRGGDGLIFLMTPIWFTTNLIVLTAAGEFVARYILPEVLNGEGFAVDPAAPHTLYVIDNRSTYPNLQTDAQQDTFLDDKNYFTLLTYTLTGAEYAFTNATVFPGADWSTAEHDGPPLTDVGNPAAVLDGLLWVTRARRLGTFTGGYWTWDGAALGEVGFTQGDAVPEIETFGAIVRPPDRPAPNQFLFATTLGDEVIRFNSAGEIAEVFEIADASRLPGGAAFCNRLIALHGFGRARREDDGVDPRGGSGGEET